MSMTQTRAIESTRACINTSVHSTVAQTYHIYARHTPPPQDLSKSEKGTEAGTHRNNPNHRPDDSHVSDTKIFYEKVTVKNLNLRPGCTGHEKLRFLE